MLRQFRRYCSATCARARASGGITLLAVVIGACAVARAAVSVPDPYMPYAFLIGEWDVAPEAGGPPAAVARFRWGPNRSYIWYSVSNLVKGDEHPHFEGIFMWNGVNKNLDMLVMLDLAGGRVQEQGTVFVGPDGTVVRDMIAVYSEGARLPPDFDSVAGPKGSKAHFRQTFAKAGPDRVLTALTLETRAGWVPTFPGSDRLAMTRRPNG